MTDSINVSFSITADKHIRLIERLSNPTTEIAGLNMQVSSSQVAKQLLGRKLNEILQDIDRPAK